MTNLRIKGLSSIKHLCQSPLHIHHRQPSRILPCSKNKPTPKTQALSLYRLRWLRDMSRCRHLHMGTLDIPLKSIRTRTKLPVACHISNSRLHLKFRHRCLHHHISNRYTPRRCNKRFTMLCQSTYKTHNRNSRYNLHSIIPPYTYPNPSLYPPKSPHNQPLPLHQLPTIWQHQMES